MLLVEIKCSFALHDNIKISCQLSSKPHAVLVNTPLKRPLSATQSELRSLVDLALCLLAKVQKTLFLQSYITPKLLPSFLYILLLLLDELPVETTTQFPSHRLTQAIAKYFMCGRRT